MIVCEDGKFKKSDYRTFRIGSVEGTDDYASMREALERRLSHLADADGSFSNLPDLILLDGGRGHVSTIRELLNEKGLDIPVFGISIITNAAFSGQKSTHEEVQQEGAKAEKRMTALIVGMLEKM